MLVRSAAIREIGLMEEAFFLYWEDTEWCARAQEKGYKVLFVPGSQVWHKVSVSAGKASFLQYYYSTRNGFFFLRRYDLFLMPIFTFFNMAFCLRSVFTGNAQPIRGLAKGMVDFVRGRSGPFDVNGGQGFQETRAKQE
jgi:GT2 family glycosyltransferase